MGHNPSGMMTINGYGNASAQANNAFGQADMTMPQQQPLGATIIDSLARLEETLCRANCSLLTLRSRVFGDHEGKHPPTGSMGSEPSSLEAAINSRLIGLQCLAHELAANAERLEARI